MKNPSYVDRIVLVPGGVIETLDGTNIIEANAAGTGATITGTEVVVASEITLAEGSVLVGNADGVGAALDASTDAQILVGDGTTIASVAVSGDVSIDNAGATVVEALDLEAATVTNIASTEILIGTGAGAGAFAALSGDVTMDNAGVVTIGAQAVEDSMLNGTLDLGTKILTLGSTTAVGTSVGTAEAGVTATENGTGQFHLTTLNFIDLDLGAIAATGAEATGALVYTLPMGVQSVEVAYMSVGVVGAVAVQADTPELGIGVLIGSGANATLGAVGATAENIITAQVMSDVNGTVTKKIVVDQPLAVEAADAHLIHLNIADTWADASATLLATGTIVLKWTSVAFL